MSTTPGALSREVAGGWAPDLTPAEREAMAADLHAATCPITAGRCIECMETFRAVRKLLRRAAPVIEAEARRDERADLIAAGRLAPEGQGPPWPICWAKRGDLLCDRREGHVGDHVDVNGPVEGRSWPVEAEPAEVPAEVPGV